jgi:putative exporter of polyketide antibiotics
MSYSPPPPPPPYGSGDYGSGYAPRRTNQKALWSMILGILGLVFCGLFAGIPALILGNSAKKEIAASGGAETGEGMAKAGVVLGWIAVAISALGLLLVMGGFLGTGRTQLG